MDANDVLGKSPAEVAVARANVRRAVTLFSGKWKLEIDWLSIQRMHRFNELRQPIPDVTQHMLTAQLRDWKPTGWRFIATTMSASRASICCDRRPRASGILGQARYGSQVWLPPVPPSDPAP
jgi:hypothetical protein